MKYMKHVIIDGRRVRRGTRMCRGGKQEFVVPRGRGSILLAVTVQGPKRAIIDTDAAFVFGFGNLKKWSVIPCSDPTRVQELARADAMELLGKSRRTPPTFWSLWKVPEQYVTRLVDRLRLRK
jgi:hypothetical protein